jgi:hypothetical protein
MKTYTHPEPESNPSELCEQLAMLRARYDSGAVAPGIYAIIRAIETELSWIEHQKVRS